MVDLFFNDTAWYIGQILVLVLFCLISLIFVVAFLATIKLCMQLCGFCNFFIISPSAYVYKRGMQLYKSYSEQVIPPTSDYLI
ncbi:envelope protein [Human coronavirus HKU1]|uniref:Envelope small membrane protein n=5 Tax=Human coronavirus HKU1 TaxID=290028 RepID=VEMP_CVHN1|nr:envelope protein [Human coronavirus HKU1]Q5MQC8.1 RecName: Full=Envelope small membrane protein; Short=E protein; Short=sM protein [Human coronavirus HKU1 (isolate N1)]AAT98583.1 small membrane protein [Human coronavirus HKU1]ABD75499.1 small membrane protein [Human coronavirus HKU1]ABD75531.1 small membrane protein [Human coronavirus HKU1]ABD75539.1 small membrane protein [Human coronavirus HKU1]ABD75555.1 small membrane protein [Human coronavirus HKU1]